MSLFAKNLKQFRKQKGFSQAKLAHRLNYGYTAIANYESGRNEPCFDTLMELAEILGITVDELLGVPFQPEEQKMLADFRKLSLENQQLISALIQALSL